MNPSQLPFLRALLPETPKLVLEDVCHENDALLIVLRSTILVVCCPLCRMPSTSVHSNYQRSPRDLPWGGHPVRLVIHVRTFFCKNASCKHRIFAERLPEVVAPRARTTERLTLLLRAIAFALGGEAGSRLTKRIGVSASPATLICLIRRTPLPTPNPARILGIDFRTARKYALSDECPTRKPHKWSRGRLLDPYEPYLRARWKEGCKNGRGLYREIRAHGYPGSRTQVAVFVAQLRREENDGKPQHTPPVSGEPLTPHRASMLLLRRPERHTEAESMALAQLQDAHAEISATISFTERFVKIVRERQGKKLGKWLCDAEASGIREVWRFAHKVRQEEAAVRNGCMLEWSNGQTEGQITKLKAIKRSMYGRAKFDLLRRRALYAA